MTRHLLNRSVSFVRTGRILASRITVFLFATGLTANMAKDYDPPGSDGDAMSFNIEFMPAIQGSVQFR
jgi:hypothetical protein